jgi:dihydropteroate synthase
LVGISRKSFIGKILNLPPQERVEGTIASAVLSVLKGAHILRVHDVEPVKRAITVAEAIMKEETDREKDVRNG